MFAAGTQIVVFDLDGTLVDSAGDIEFAANHVRRLRGLSEFRREEILPLIGRPAGDLFLDAREDGPSMVADFREVLAEVTGTYSWVYPCVLELLTQLRDQGWELAVASNKPSYLAQIVLDRMDLGGFFTNVQGSENSPPKPDPAIVRAALGLQPWRVAHLVGDTPQDIIAGRSAGIGTIAVSTGGHSRAALKEHHPDLIVDSLCELIPLLG